MACVVEGCKTHSSRKETTNELVTFHRFPKDETMKAIWVQRLSRFNWTPKKHSHICSKHFTIDSFVLNENLKYRRLKLNAIPTLNLGDKANINEIKTEPSDTDFHFQASQPNCEKRLLSDSSEDTPESKCLKIESECLEISEQDVAFSIEISALQKKNRELEIELADYKKRNAILEKELERVKKVSKQHVRKINTLSKRNSRNKKRHECNVVVNVVAPPPNTEQFLVIHN